MKKTLFAALILTVESVWAQTIPATTPTPPAAPPQQVISGPNRAGAADSTAQNPNEGRFMGVFSNALGAAGTMLSNRFGLTNGIASSTNNVPETNPVAADTTAVNNVADVVARLQADMEQALPTVQGIISRTPLGQAPAATGQTLPIPGTPAPGTGGVYARIGTNVFSVTPETYRLLTVLENDLRQTLPVLRALNGTAGLTMNSSPSGFSGRFTAVPPTNASGRVLAPTGR